MSHRYHMNPKAMAAMGKRFMPLFLMVLVHIAYSFLYFITEAAFSHGQSTRVYVTYRLLVAGVTMLPFAYFIERNERPRLTWGLFLEIFLLAFLGVTLSVNMFYGSFMYTSPTFLASVFNSVSSLTFVIAVILRLETLDIRSAGGMAKIFGTVISLVGVLTVSLYRGKRIANPGHGSITHIQGSAIHEDWVKGPMLAIGSCLTLSAWYIGQAYTLRRYPARLSLATLINFIAAAQTAIFAVALEHEPKTWAIKGDIDLWNTLYGGVVVSGMVTYILLWCTKERGPVFVTLFSPLSTVMVALSAYFVLGEKLYMGSIIGAFIVIIGLYLILWGKENDKKNQEKHNTSIVGWKAKYQPQESTATDEEHKQNQDVQNGV